MITASERFEIMTAEMRPQDDSMDGTGLTFKTLEHGGAYPDTMPQAIRVTDKEGRWCIYTPTTYRGEVVQHHGFEYQEDAPSPDGIKYKGSSTQAPFCGKLRIV